MAPFFAIVVSTENGGLLGVPYIPKVCETDGLTQSFQPAHVIEIRVRENEAKKLPARVVFAEEFDGVSQLISCCGIGRGNPAKNAEIGRCAERG